MIKKETKKKLYISSAVLIILLLASFFIPLSKTPNTALQDNEQIIRTTYPNYEEVSSGIKGTAQLPSIVNPENVNSIQFVSNACSVLVDVLLNNQKVGVLSFPSCESQFYGEQGLPFQHYPEKRLTYEINGLDSSSFRYEFVPKENNPLTFDKEGQQSVSLSDFSYKVEITEIVECTRSSQCPKININGNRLQSFCSLSHECSLDSSAVKIENTEIIPDPRELMSFNVSAWIYPLGALVIFVIIALFIFRKNIFKGRKR